MKFRPPGLWQMHIHIPRTHSEEQHLQQQEPQRRSRHACTKKGTHSAWQQQ